MANEHGAWQPRVTQFESERSLPGKYPKIMDISAYRNSNQWKKELIIGHLKHNPNLNAIDIADYYNWSASETHLLVKHLKEEGMTK